MERDFQVEKKTIRFALTGSHSVSGVVNFAAGAVFYFTTEKPRSRGRIEKKNLAALKGIIYLL